jgi:Protein of unknown function (DUF3574)
MRVAASKRTLSRVTLGVALLVAGTGLGAAAPSAFGQAVPALGQAQAEPANGRDRDDRVCAGRAEPAGVSPFLRTELYFGSNKPDGTVVSEAEFQRFLDHEITPRFPDGLTLLTGLGQFRGSSGRIEKERSMLLILLYPTDTARSSGQKIEQIRDAYERMFQQESVLRADEPLPECVSF